MKAEMVTKEDTSRPVLLTWGFNAHNGDIYLDAFLELEKNPEATAMIFLRATAQNVKVALLRIPYGAEREDIEDWLESSGKEAITLLKKARVNGITQVLRKKDENNTVEYLKQL